MITSLLTVAAIGYVASKFTYVKAKAKEVDIWITQKVNDIQNTETPAE